MTTCPVCEQTTLRQVEPGVYECEPCVDFAEQDWRKNHASRLPERKNCGRLS
jgi:ribosomal protein L37AE/L43A